MQSACTPRSPLGADPERCQTANPRKTVAQCREAVAFLGVELAHPDGPAARQEMVLFHLHLGTQDKAAKGL
jgi:hypothetical protein